MPSQFRLREQLDRWVAHGLITPEQAGRIFAEEQAEPEGNLGPSRPVSLVTEALGYVGGVLILVAAVPIAGRYWSDLGLGGRLSMAFGAAAVLFLAGAGLAKRLGSVGARLRAVCWLLSAATFAAGMVLLGAEVLDLPHESASLLAAGGTAVYAGVLWRRHRGVLQQAAVVGALAVTAASAAAHLPGGDETLIGIAVWGVGVTWLLLGWGRVVAARYTAFVLGGAAAVVGPQLTLHVGWGAGFAIGSAVALVTAGVWLRDLVLLGVGSVATLVTVPRVLDLYFPDTLTASLVLLGAGVVLLAAAVFTARRQPNP